MIIIKLLRGTLCHYVMTCAALFLPPGQQEWWEPGNYGRQYFCQWKNRPLLCQSLWHEEHAVFDVWKADTWFKDCTHGSIVCPLYQLYNVAGGYQPVIKSSPQVVDTETVGKPEVPL